MINVYSKALDNKIAVNRVLANIKGAKKGPTIVFFGGIHGNETSGVFALKDALDGINPSHVHGHIYGIVGNFKALQLQQRFVDEDLNRLWTKERIAEIKNKSVLNTEEQSLLELLDILNKILESNKPPFYFIDLHSTSSKTLPFITINDALINRKFSSQFPVPIVLGIEEYLQGPLLSYINEMGYVSLGFESGQHDDLRAITNNIAFIYLSLVYSGILEKKGVVKFKNYYEQLQNQAANMVNVFEVIYLHTIKPTDTFNMHTGFKSFQNITKGTKLALSNNIEVKAKYSGVMFMPLYQQRGNDGFFIINPINPFLLKLSTVLRHIKIDNLLVILPGVSWLNKKEGILQVNLKIAKYFAKSLFHLLGYRNRHLTPTHLRLNNRERVAKTAIYKNEKWY